MSPPSKTAPPLSADKVLSVLESAGTAQNRKVYARHGVRGPMFGVSFKELTVLAKRIGKNLSLAEELWESGHHDARVLATMIADPTTIKSSTLDAWSRDLDNYVVADAFSKLAARSPFAQTKVKRWTASKREFVGQAGWNMLSIFAMEQVDLADEYFVPFLTEIAEQIHHRVNRVRHAMNQSVIAIGGRNESLRRQAEAAADVIGVVRVDHGDTGCKTPDARDYIARMWQHKQQRRQSP